MFKKKLQGIGYECYFLFMKILALTLLVIIVSGTLTAQAEEKPLDQCIADINSGDWRNANRGHLCHYHFDLPSPWLLKCLKFEHHNYKNSSERERDLNLRACHVYFKDSSERAFKEHSDYDIDRDMPEELRRVFYILKRAFTLKTDL